MYKYAQVVLGLPVDKAFTYGIPDNFRETIKIGQRVEVPFGRRWETGYVSGFLNETQVKGIKPLRKIFDQQPILDDQILKLTRKVADYYCASWGEVIEAAIPAGVRRRRRQLEILDNSSAALSNIESSLIEEKLQPSVQQKRALRLIKKNIREKRHQVFLLYGITASGKTEVYLQAIEEVIKQGMTSIVLVPEIALTSQTAERFRLRFGAPVALMHSRLLASQRLAQWRMIKDGLVQIVIGARSAVFSPLKNLGLIVVDEEHETTYKQSDAAPRYHAREVAIMRARLAKATVILGSATPSLESFYSARQGKIKLLTLPQRVTKKDLPAVVIVDMRREISIRRRTNIFSRVLEEKIRQAIKQGEQVIIFLNRRGFSTFISCAQCGYVAKCKHCNVSLTYHYANKKLICHYCNYNIEPPQICPQCSSSYLRYFGLGTEKVESEAHRLFSPARIARMDTDVTRKKDAHTKILDDFKNGEIDVLIGTQMIAKGLDFPRVSLVGVVSSDTALNLPDFRSGERTFNLLTQVAGRAGRGDKEGEVIIQTYVPEHYAINASIRHDYRLFYSREIKSRKALELPPFTHLVNLTLRGRTQEKVQRLADELSQELEKNKPAKSIQVLGPAPAIVPRLRGNFLWNVLLKGENLQSLTKLLRQVLKNFKRYKGVVLSVDVDPV